MDEIQILLRIFKNSYCFCYTKDKSRIDLLRLFQNKLVNLAITCDTINGFEGGSLIIKKEREKKDSPFIFFSALNDQNDYNNDQLLNVNLESNQARQYDSLISCSFIHINSFIAYSDYMGIIGHYYYYDDNTIIVSNNSFLVALLAEETINPEAIFETMFFRFPYKTGSYFKNVKSLYHYKYLQYSLDNHKMVIQEFKHPDSLADYYLCNSEEGVKDYFEKVHRLYNRVSVSFSGGSDSMTIASLLDRFGIQYDLVSFEGHDDYDTKRILKLARKLRKEIKLYSVRNIENDNLEGKEYTIVSNGYSVSDHFYRFYKQLKGETVFDGYSFVLGDWSDAFLSDIHRNALKCKNLNFVLHRFLEGLDESFILNLGNFLKNNYSFPDINEDDALKYVQDYSQDFICSRIIAGAILPTVYFKVNNHSFFLSKKFFSPILCDGYGISSTFTGRINYPGYIKNRLPLAHLSSTSGSKAFEIPMDKGISLKDILKEDWLNETKSKIFKKRKAIYNKFHQSLKNKNLISDQNDIIYKYPYFVQDESNLSPYLKNQLRLIKRVEESLFWLRNQFTIP